MKALWKTQFVLIGVLLTGLVTACSTRSQTSFLGYSQVRLNANSPFVVNLDGDLSLDGFEDHMYWSPHATGLEDVSKWNVTFTDELSISIKTERADSGHVAAGAWWTSAFKPANKLSLYSSKPMRLLASFTANVAFAKCISGQEWLRFAIAFAVQRSDGSVVYTELDFWDSPKVLDSEKGDVRTGGDLIYSGGGVVEYKIAQAGIGIWTNYSLDLGSCFDRAWSVKTGDMLESVYLVVEVVGDVEVLLKADNLWIAVFDATEKIGL